MATAEKINCFKLILDEDEKNELNKIVGELLDKQSTPIKMEILKAQLYAQVSCFCERLIIRQWD